MVSEFKFFRIHKGLPYFAKVRVVSGAGASALSPSAVKHRIPTAWVKAAERGVAKALDEHIKSGGSWQSLIVDEVIGIEVDSNENTMEVAAFCAAWQALGHLEAELAVTFDGQWQVRRTT
jgi:hypothetical protein